MIKQKDLEPLTGYIHGGCSPIGMKKKFPTYLDKTVENFSEIFVSGGRVGLQIKIGKNQIVILLIKPVTNDFSILNFNKI